MAKVTTPLASAVVNRHSLPLNDALIKAFGEAWDNFVSAHGREPEVDICSFRGGFTTFDVIFEIDEDG